MSNYDNSWDGLGKLSRQDPILAADFDTEFDKIQTAIASKIDKAGSATAGNFADHAAGGALADSGVADTYFTTISSNVQTQIDTLQSKVAQATGHVRNGVLQLYEGTATKVNLASGRSPATWYKVGPTGSGADIIMADLDDTPLSAQGGLFTLVSRFDVQSGSQAESACNLRVSPDEDADPPTSIFSVVFQATFTHPVAGDMVDSLQIDIPFASDNTFDIYMQVGGGYDLTDWTNIELIYNGFYT